MRFAAMLPFLFFAAEAFARPGGGSSFSGGGGSSGGGSGDGIELFFDIAIFLIEVISDYPELAGSLVTLILVVGLAAVAFVNKGVTSVIFGLLSLGGAGAGVAWVPNFVYVAIAFGGGVGLLFVLGSLGDKKKPREWSTAPPKPQTSGRTPATERALFKKIARQDPDFSPVVFADFVYALYAEVQRARGGQKLKLLAPYLTQEVRSAIENAELTSVEDVVVASMRITDGSVKDDVTRLEIEFETNFTEHTRAGAKSFYHREHWKLRRMAGAKSRPPEKVSTFHCPNCGAPIDPEQSSTCRMCRETIDTGRFDWLVEGIWGRERTEKGPMLTAQVEERGTDKPTVIDPRLTEATAELTKRDPAFDFASFDRRVKRVFETFQTAWSARDLRAMRPFLSDRLFVAQQYWITAYKKAGLRNVTENARITTLERARVTTDKYYDAITVRLFASSLDYTVDEQGKVIVGSKKKERAYSEYWTFIRSVEQRGAAGETLTCPNCGKALDINMAGACSACGAKLTSGRFDWVLSRIEQDDVYQ